MVENRIENLQLEIGIWIDEVGVLVLLSCISDVCGEICADCTADHSCQEQVKCRVKVEINQLLGRITSNLDSSIIVHNSESAPDSRSPMIKGATPEAPVVIHRLLPVSFY